MSEGPFGGPRPFIRDKRTIIVLLGIDDTTPPPPVQFDLRESINGTINQTLIDAGANINKTRSTVDLTVNQQPTQEQIDVLGSKTLHVQQYDVKTELNEVSQELVNLIHNTVVERVAELGFNIIGAETTVT